MPEGGIKLSTRAGVKGKAAERAGAHGGAACGSAEQQGHRSQSPVTGISTLLETKTNSGY